MRSGLLVVAAVGVGAAAVVSAGRRRPCRGLPRPVVSGGVRRAGHRSGSPPAPRPVRTALLGAGVPDRLVERVWPAAAVGVPAAVVTAAIVVGPLAAAVGLAGVVLVAVLARSAVGDRAAVAVDRELPVVLGAVAAGVRSGASLGQAVREGAARARGPVADDLAAVVDALTAGRPLTEALSGWAAGRGTAGVRMTVAALTLAAETGGAGARTIDGVAATLRDRVAVDRELAALSSQARASAVVVGVAPIGFVVLTALVDPGVWDFFLRQPAGLGCLAGGALLDAVGAAWMIAIARGTR